MVGSGRPPRGWAATGCASSRSSAARSPGRRSSRRSTSAGSGRRRARPSSISRGSPIRRSRRCPAGTPTKRIPGALLDARRVDALVLLLAEGEAPASPWTASRFARGVEQRVALLPGAGDAFAPVAVSGVPHLRYVVLRRRAGHADAGEAPLDTGAQRDR